MKRFCKWSQPAMQHSEPPVSPGSSIILSSCKLVHKPNHRHCSKQMKSGTCMGVTEHLPMVPGRFSISGQTASLPHWDQNQIDRRTVGDGCKGKGWGSFRLGSQLQLNTDYRRITETSPKQRLLRKSEGNKNILSSKANIICICQHSSQVWSNLI